MAISEFLNSLKEYWFVIIAVAGFLYYFYKKEVAKLEIWKNEYFDKILVPFHMQYLKYSSINVRKFLNKIDIYSKEYTPSYLFYLAKKNEYEQIRKILVVDYENNYPSPKNISFDSQNKAMNAVGFFVEFGSVLMFSACLLFSFLCLFSIFAELIDGLQTNTWSTVSVGEAEVLTIYTYIAAFLFLIIICIILIFSFRSHDYTDCYSSKQKIIRKLVKQKIKSYDKISNRLFYLIK